jgi:CHAT domain-containing protein
MDRTHRWFLALAAPLLLAGCMTNVIPERDRALTAGRFREAAAAAEADIAAIEAAGQTPKTAQLFSACVSYSKLKNYEKLFPCLDRLDANVARGDVSNVDMAHMKANSLLMRMVPMPENEQTMGNIAPMVPLMRGEAWLDLGRTKDALAQADLALQLAPRGGPAERSYTIYALGLKGVAQAQLGRRDDAQATIATLAAIGTSYPYVLLATDKQMGLARTHVALGDWQQAHEWLKQDDNAAFRGFANFVVKAVIGDVDVFTITQLPKQFMYNKSLLETGRAAEAKAGYDELLKHPAIPDLGEYYWMLLYDRGRIAQQEGDLAGAIGFYQRAVEVIEAQRATVGSEASRIGFVGSKQDVYEALVDALFVAQLYPQAFDLVERSKSRALVDMLASKKDFAVPAGDPEQVKALVAMATAGDALAWQGASGDELGRARSASQQATSRLRSQAPELADLVAVSALPVAAIQELLPKGETLLEYYHDGSFLYAFVVRDGQLTARRHASGELGGKVLQARRLLTNPASDPLPALQVLYRELIAPLDDVLGDRLTIVPHGPLHYIPWGALHDGNAFLLQKRAFRLLPSANVLPFVNRRRGAQAEGALLAFGNPDLGDRRMDLPSAQAEALKVTDGRARSRAMTRLDATETALRKYGASFRWLHFATHGEFDAAAPLDSGLLLAKDAQNDGRVTAGELYSMRLDADLVTLSACETGVGKVSGGDDVVGLVRGFLYAGANSIVASLWQVDDSATSEIMVRFYENLERADKRDALRRAQLEVFDEKPHPFYWAAFQLTGNVR